MGDLPQPGFLFSLAMFVVMVSVLVTVHEFGHYLVGRFFGVKVETFSVGMGPEVFARTDRHGTRWRIAALPIGGYCKFMGDMDASSRPDNEAHGWSAEKKAQAFPFKPLWQRALIVLAGPAINLLFAWFLFWGLISLNGLPMLKPVAGSITVGSVAEKAGFRVGDVVMAVNGDEVEQFFDLQQIVAMNYGKPLTFDVRRGGSQVTLTATPETAIFKDNFGNEMRYGKLGLGSSGKPERVKIGPVRAIGASFSYGVQQVDFALKGLAKIFRGEVSMNEVGGPVKIGDMAGKAASQGWQSFVASMALVSISLAIMNLLPVPVLDGGHLALYAAEAIRGKPLNPKVLELAFSAGFALIVGLMLFLFWNDLRLFGVWRNLAGLWS
jgi:regulator of sigma E protease